MPTMEPDEDGFTMINSNSTKRQATEPPVSFEPPDSGGQNNTSMSTGRTVKTLKQRIRFEFPITNQTFLAQPEARSVLKAMKNIEPTLKIHAIETTGNVVDDVEEIPVTEEGFKRYFAYSKQKPPNTGLKHVIFVKIETSRTLDEIKLDLMHYLQPKSIFMRRHEWECFEILAIGFFAKLHPRIHWRDDLETTTRNAIISIIGEDKATTIPPFKLVRLTKNIGNERRIKADVIEVHCDKIHGEELKKIFASPQFAQLTEGRFIPEGTLQIVGETTYRNILIEHNRYTSQIRTIPIENLTVNAMQNLFNNDCQNLEELILNGTTGQYTTLTIRIHRTAATTEKGRWLISFPQQHMSAVKAHLEHITMVIFPKMHKDNGMSNADYLCNGAPPGLAGRPTADPHMSSCLSSLTSDFAQIPPEGEDELNQLAKKRRTYGMSYANVLIPKMIVSDPTNAPTGTASTMSLSEDKIQKLMATQFKQQQTQNKELFADFARATDIKLDSKLNEFSRNQDAKFDAFDKSQTTKLTGFTTETYNFLQGQQSNFNEVMQQKFIDTAHEQDKKFAAFQESMAIQLNATTHINNTPSHAASNSSRVPLSGEDR